MKKAGIYIIECPNNEIYIGQTKNFKRRVDYYRYNKLGAGVSIPMHNSINLHGIANHNFSLLHELPTDVSSDILDNYEQTYMDFYRNAGFVLLNLREGGLHGKHSEISKKRNSDTVKKQFKNGRVISEETKAALSNKHRGNTYNLGRKHTHFEKESRSKWMKNAEWKLPSKKVMCLNNGVVYETQRLAALDLGISYKHICCVCKGRRNHINGLKFKYV